MSDFWNKDRCEVCGRINTPDYVGTEAPCWCHGSTNTGFAGTVQYPVYAGSSDGAAMRADAMRGYYIVEIRPEQWNEIVERLTRIETIHAGFPTLRDACQDYLDYIEEHGDPSDQKQYVFEAAMEMCFGKGIWKQVNAAMRSDE